MPTIIINGKSCEFTPGEKILEIANREGVEIPQYCYHEGLSIPAQCRICLAEIWAPNPRNDNKLEPMLGGKLQPTCSTNAADGMVIHADSPKSVANQKAVMEYLLLNHPLDCPICDQAGECTLQDFSYKYGRSASRFEEQKVKQPKKNIGPNIYIYSDRCIMCTRCVRFAREVPGTGELMIDGRGNQSQIDVFPGIGIDNELASNVIDLCPVGALLDKDFLFTQRVWFLKKTPSIDGITASGDNISIEHNQGKIYRIKPRTNLAVNKWWITDEVRYGWKFVHSESRLTEPRRLQHGTLAISGWQRTLEQALDGLKAKSVDAGKRLGLVVSPMLSCEDAFLLATLANRLDPDVVLAVGPVPFDGQDKSFPPGIDPADPKAFTMYAEKAPNARGIKRVLESFGPVTDFNDWIGQVHGGIIGATIVTGNYPSDWATAEVATALAKTYLVLIDTLENALGEQADIVLPAATWAEKAGTFENVKGMLQSFEQAIPVVGSAKAEAQIALDALALLDGGHLTQPRAGYDDLIVDEGPGQVPSATSSVALPRSVLYNAASVRTQMAGANESLRVFVTDVATPILEQESRTDMPLVQL